MKGPASLPVGKYGHGPSSIDRICLSLISVAGCAIKPQHAEEAVEWLTNLSLSPLNPLTYQTTTKQQRGASFGRRRK